MSSELCFTDLSGKSFRISFDSSRLKGQLVLDGDSRWDFTLLWNLPTVQVKPEASLVSDEAQLANLRFIEAVFAYESSVTRVEVEGPLAMSWERSAFYLENPALWVRQAPSAGISDTWTETQGRTHPLRPFVQAGQLYRRWIPQLGKTLSFELLDMEKHLDTFHDWQNQARVAKFWEIDKPLSELRAYVEKVHADPHHIPVIGAIDDVAVGYFEVYWTAEDRLGPYYDAGPYDRGFHMLIGNTDFLGGPYTMEFLRALGHWLFLDEPRTERIMAEPRSDNKKMLRYVDAYPVWKNLREFDFPHKRACLLEFAKDRFLKGGGL